MNFITVTFIMTAYTFLVRICFRLAFVEVEALQVRLKLHACWIVWKAQTTVIPQLRVLRLAVDVAKKGAIPNFDDAIAKIRFKLDDKEEVTIDYGDEATKLLQLVYAVNELDPDIILTSAGDSYLFPYLIQKSRRQRCTGRVHIKPRQSAS